MDFNQTFSSTTVASDAIYGVASSTINLFGIALPFWLAWMGILLGTFFGIGICLAVFMAVSRAIGSRWKFSTASVLR